MRELSDPSGCTADDNVPTVSVVVPVFNGGAAFRSCLSSLAGLYPPAHEVIVVDDSSDDGSGSLAGEFGARLFSTPARCGPARARNLGARQASGELLLFVDADVAVTPDTVGQVASAFRLDQDLAALFGSYDDEPAAVDFLSQYKNLMHHYVHQTGREDAFTFWAGCGAIRRDLFLDLGGFDERYRNPAIEDIELGYRLKSAGSKILLLKSLQVKHMKPWSPPGLVRTDFTRRALPWAELILRQRHFDNDLNIDLSARISVVAAYMLVGALIASFWWLPLLAIASACVFILLLHNLPLYRFFARKRGLLFALQTVPWHWLYFLYSGLAFALALVRHLYRAHVLRRLIGRDVGWEDSEPPQAVRGR